MSGAPPLRFLGLVLGGWVAVRAALLVPAWWRAGEAPSQLLIEPASASPASGAVVVRPSLSPRGAARVSESASATQLSTAVRTNRSSRRFTGDPAAKPAVASEGVQLAQAFVPAMPPPGKPPSAQPALPAALPSRWSVSAWALVRRGEGRQLATGGVLGGSQVGARLTYRLREGLALSGRVYAPLGQPQGAEAALGIEWQPARKLPVRVLAERRQAIGQEGRSAFALLAHGGVSDRPVLGPLRLDAYVQAGLVGLKSRDGFVDGAVRVGLPLSDDLSIGVGGWGAAQPGVSRLDAGPQLSYRVPAFGETLRLSAEWRVRIAGDARPGSGPALTLSTDF